MGASGATQEGRLHMNDPELGHCFDEAVARWAVRVGQCLFWTGSLHHQGTTRYPAIGINGRRYYVRRLMWELMRGPIPGGVAVVPGCGNDLCVEPDHLELVPLKRGPIGSATHHPPVPPRLLLCRECGAEYVATHGRQLCCSDACRLARARRSDRDRKRRERARARGR